MMKVLSLSSKSQSRLLIILIASIVLACYLPTLNNGFVWDDDVNLIGNFNYRGLSSSNLFWMFTTFHDANYHPLCWLTFGLDFILWDMNPTGYHLTNLVLHVLNAVLFFILIIEFLRLTSIVSTDIDMLSIKASAAVGALFFAIHPLRVENVSWISTRGDVLCSFFYILTIIAYLRMVDMEASIDRRKWFLLSILFFLFSLLSRAWGITMPLVLLILDFYPLRRLAPGFRPRSSFNKLLIEKIPFALLALGGGVAAFLAKKGPMLNVPDHGVIDRFMQAAYGLCFYLYKTIVPVRLSPFYLLDKSFNPMEAKYITCALLVLCITLVLTIMRRRWPWALTAWICYAVIVSPVLGFVQSGPQIAADRYTYIACMPFGILVGAGILRMLISWRIESYPLLVWLSVVAAILTGLLFLTINSSRQVGYWRDSHSLWNHVLQLDPDNYLAYYNRGVVNQDQYKLAEAIADYSSAAKLNPEYSEAYYNRGVSLESQGDFTGAITDYSKAIQLNPKYVEAYNNHGALLKAKGDLAGAVADFNTAIRLNPLSPEAYANRGGIRLSQNDLKKAVQDFTKALEVAPENWSHRVQIEQILGDVRARLDS
jgi:Flp pilus assembly protein TadD